MMPIAAYGALAAGKASDARRTTFKVMRYEIRDVLRSRWLLGFSLFFLVATDVLLRFSGDRTNALLSEMNVVLALVPLVAIVFGTMYLFDAREFIELLLAQPVGRGTLYAGLYLGLAVPMSLGFLAGAGIPFLAHGLDDPAQRSTLLTLLMLGAALTFAFTGIAFALALHANDKARALGAAIAVWLFLTVLYDGVVLLVATMFGDYALERPMLALMLANPVDLARVLLLLRVDVAALMGYTGAVFKSFFGTAGGSLLALAVLAAWTVAPALYAKRLFRTKDF